jgi:diguanylate cyclase (GGDEF)-like protein
MKIKNLEFNTKDVLVKELKDVENITIGEISRHFTHNKIEVIVITKNNKPFYILTATDIIDALVAHYDFMKISEYVDKHPKGIITIKENETVFEAYSLMRSYKIHHLVVVDEEGYYKTLINFYDFASYLTEIAIRDEMTGLYNKRFFEFILDKYKNEDIEIGIIFLDLDNFKQINDLYGHLFGDKVIKKIADIIKESIRDIDYAFRFGGDEFVIMIFNSNEVLVKVANRIKNKVAKTKIDDVEIECSFGYAHYKTDSDNLEEVLKLADKRMYEEKKIKS